MHRQHHYSIHVLWTGNRGQGTPNYKGYDRSHIVSIEGKPDIAGSSDAAFSGDKTKYTPEDMLVASLSTCHMLWYLHLCSEGGVVVTEYTDIAKGTMIETSDGGGHFTEVTLYPVVTVSEQSMEETANALHKKANELCFIANSVNFPVYHKVSCKVKP